MVLKRTMERKSHLESFLLWTWNEMNDSLKETKNAITTVDDGRRRNYAVGFGRDHAS